jgi:hypothetical protein
VTTRENPGGATGALNRTTAKKSDSESTAHPAQFVASLSDAELEKVSRRWSAAARQAAQELPGSLQLDTVLHAAAVARLELRRRRAAANLASAFAEVERLGGAA